MSYGDRNIERESMPEVLRVAYERVHHVSNGRMNLDRIYNAQNPQIVDIPTENQYQFPDVVAEYAPDQAQIINFPATTEAESQTLLATDARQKIEQIKDAA